MAQALDAFHPYDAGAGSSITEAQWRAMARAWSTDGPLRGELSSWNVSTAAGRNVSIGAGRVWVRGQYGELTSAFTQPFTANASGNPRIDTVVLRNDFVNNKIELDVLVGTPAASPVAPTLTQNTSVWEIALYDALLASGYSSIALSAVTDRRRFAAGRPPGGPGLITADGNRDTNFAVGDGVWTLLNLNSAENYDTAAIHDAAGATPWRFTIPGGCDGIWVFHGINTWAANATGDRGLRIMKNGGVLRSFPFGRPNAVFAATTDGYHEDRFVAGDTVDFEVFQSSGGSLNVTAARVTARYLGSLAA